MYSLRSKVMNQDSVVFETVKSKEDIIKLVNFADNMVITLSAKKKSVTKDLTDLSEEIAELYGGKAISTKDIPLSLINLVLGQYNLIIW